MPVLLVKRKKRIKSINRNSKKVNKRVNRRRKLPIKTNLIVKRKKRRKLPVKKNLLVKRKKRIKIMRKKVNKHVKKNLLSKKVNEYVNRRRK